MRKSRTHGASVPMSAVEVGEGRRSAKLKLAVGAIGIVFGDIGTSPIYAFRETFVGPHKLAIDDVHILGVVSLIFWSMTIVVSLQYVTVLLRADNKGEGGTLALVAMLGRYIGGSQVELADGAAGVSRHLAVLRRQHDHAGDLGALGGRGSRPSSRPACRNGSCRSRWCC